MREMNVKALAALLEEAVAASAGGYRLISRNVGGDTGHPMLTDPAHLAEWLVEAGGVVVPAAITEQEARDLLHQQPALEYARVTAESEGQSLREGLCRIATDRVPGHRDAEGEAILCLKGTHQWSPPASAGRLPVDAGAGPAR